MKNGSEMRTGLRMNSKGGGGGETEVTRKGLDEKSRCCETFPSQLAL